MRPFSLAERGEAWGEILYLKHKITLKDRENQ